MSAIIDAVARVTPVRVQGRRHVADCPLCGTKATLAINSTLGLFHCFACQAEGDTATFEEATR